MVTCIKNHFDENGIAEIESSNSLRKLTAIIANILFKENVLLVILG